MTTEVEAWTLLAIDDHGLFRSGLKLILEAHFPRSRIVVAETVAEARAMADLVPNVILLDIMLKGGSGLAEIPRLRRDLPDCQIVVVSGDDGLGAREMALAAGAIEFVRKAADPAEMLGVIQSIFNRQTDGNGAARKPVSFTARQTEIFALLQQGKSNKAIALHLGLSEFTVRGHVQAILKLLGVQSRSAAVFEYQRLNGRL